MLSASCHDNLLREESHCRSIKQLCLAELVVTIQESIVLSCQFFKPLLSFLLQHSLPLESLFPGQLFLRVLLESLLTVVFLVLAQVLLSLILALSLQLYFELLYSLASQVLYAVFTSFAPIRLDKLKVLITGTFTVNKAVIVSLQAGVVLDESSCWVPRFMVGELPVAQPDFRAVAGVHRHRLLEFVRSH